jgi:hypothetical protein
MLERFMPPMNIFFNLAPEQFTARREAKVFNGAQAIRRMDAI